MGQWIQCEFGGLFAGQTIRTRSTTSTNTCWMKRSPSLKNHGRRGDVRLRSNSYTVRSIQNGANAPTRSIKLFHLKQSFRYALFVSLIRWYIKGRPQTFKNAVSNLRQRCCPSNVQSILSAVAEAIDVSGIGLGQIRTNNGQSLKDAVPRPKMTVEVLKQYCSFDATRFRQRVRPCRSARRDI